MLVMDEFVFSPWMGSESMFGGRDRPPRRSPSFHHHHQSSLHPHHEVRRLRMPWWWDEDEEKRPRHLRQKKENHKLLHLQSSANPLLRELAMLNLIDTKENNVKENNAKENSGVIHDSVHRCHENRSKARESRNSGEEKDPRKEIIPGRQKVEGETSTMIRLPQGFRAENLQIDLDETKRTLTVSLRKDPSSLSRSIIRQSTPWNEWRTSMILNDHLDLSNLEAKFDGRKGELHLRAPLLISTSSVKESPNEETTKKKTEEEEEENSLIDDGGYITDGLDDDEMEKPPTPSPSTSPISHRREVEIEDVGPEEDIDAISISSSSSSSANEDNYILCD